MKPPKKTQSRRRKVAEPTPAKKPLDIEVAMARLREAVRPFPKAALFELAAEGFTSVFEQLVACIISIRTMDEVTLPVARRLFAKARSPEQVAQLSPDKIDELIGACTYHEPKSRTIHEIARRTVEEFGGELPCDPEALQSFHGVGPKCANLAAGIACGQASIGVDIQGILVALQERLPREYWIEINALLVPFGKHICTGTRPHCSTCPLLEMCQQVGVTSHR